MVLFTCYHETLPSNRGSIQRIGLLAGKPPEFSGQPVGVYAYSDYLRNQNAFPTVEWVCPPDADLWRITYCGPMRPDPLVHNAVILPAIPHVTLVTGNEE